MNDDDLFSDATVPTLGTLTLVLGVLGLLWPMMLVRGVALLFAMIGASILIGMACAYLWRIAEERGW